MDQTVNRSRFPVIPAEDASNPEQTQEVTYTERLPVTSGAGEAAHKLHYTISEDRTKARPTFELTPAGSEQRPSRSIAEGDRGLLEYLGGKPESSPSNQALRDYQAQLAILEYQNKKRLTMARQEKESADRDLRDRQMFRTAKFPSLSAGLAQPSSSINGSLKDKQVSHDSAAEIEGDPEASYMNASEQALHSTIHPFSSSSEQHVARISELEAQLRELKYHGEQSRPPSTHIQMFHVLPRTGRDEGYDGEAASQYEFDDDEEAEDDDMYDDASLYQGRTYLDFPQWEVHGAGFSLTARIPVLDATVMSERNKALFSVYNIYSKKQGAHAAKQAAEAYLALPAPVPACHRVEIISGELKEAIRDAFSGRPRLLKELKDFSGGRCWRSPFAWWHLNRDSMRPEGLSKRQLELVTVLTSWLDENYGSMYREVDDQFHRSTVSRLSIRFFAQPGELLLSTNEDGSQQGYIAESFPFFQEDSGDKNTWSIHCRSFGYSGDFYWKSENLSVKLQRMEESEGDISIAGLSVIPFRFASTKDRERLRRRGLLFWQCRGKRLVSYEGSLQYGKYKGQRFMIDYKSYRSFHPGRIYGAEHAPGRMAGPVQGLPKDEQTPGEPLIYLFPPHLPGFDLRYKKWIDLEVDQIREVKWKENAFDHLVFNQEMKDIIFSLVTNQLESGKGTDIIDNKGNGLIMLLHGSPGTGKTYTAESVAEMARKPLYPVTCGDIGTEPETVEKYLEQVFHLGKEWDCVVLLDEAEVFLEQRTLSDLKRNALVSVFLRALEYYEGILILTTNRVGTFDEAFKSRIQLALRYERLQFHQREQIWRNFLSRLGELGEEERVDFDDITVHIEDLAKHNMNGRQIRNTITTARQLAKHKKRKMNYSHLQQAIKVADKFDTYLAGVREGDVDESGVVKENGRYTDEYFARSDQIR